MITKKWGAIAQLVPLAQCSHVSSRVFPRNTVYAMGNISIGLQRRGVCQLTMLMQSIRITRTAMNHGMPPSSTTAQLSRSTEIKGTQRQLVA